MNQSSRERSNSDTAELLIRGYSGRIFLVIAGGMLVTNLGRQALPPLLPAIIDGLAITPAAAGFALTLMRICFAIFQYPSGRVADTTSRKLAIVGGLAGLVVGFVILSQMLTYAVLLVSMALLGIGAAFFFVAERVLLSDLFVERRGLAFGANSAVSRLGSILAAGLAVAALSLGPWQSAFLPVIGLLLVVLVLFHVISKEPYRPRNLFGAQNTSQQLRETVGRVFGNPEIRYLVIVYTLVIFVWEGTMGFLPTFLQVTKGFSTEFASGGFASLFAVGIVVQPLSGTISDRWGRLPVAGIATVISFVGIVVLITAVDFGVVILGIVLYATGLMAFTPVLQAHLLDVFPEASKGGDLGAFKTIYEGLSSVGPTYVGVVAGVASYTIAFNGFLVCLAVSAGVLFWLRYRHN